MIHKRKSVKRILGSWTIECVCGWRISRDSRHMAGRALGKHIRGEVA